MKQPSDEALELLDFFIDINAISVSSAVTSAEFMAALDIREPTTLDILLRELINENYVERRNPPSISGKVRYHVNKPQFDKLIVWFDKAEEAIRPAAVNTDWLSIGKDIQSLRTVLDQSELTQLQRSQAGAIIVSVAALVEAPDPPKKVIRTLLYDLAAVATVFALALEIANKLI